MRFKVHIFNTKDMFKLGDNHSVDDNTGKIIYKRYYKKTKDTFLKVEVKKLKGRLKRYIDHMMAIEKALMFGGKKC